MFHMHSSFLASSSLLSHLSLFSIAWTMAEEEVILSFRSLFYALTRHRNYYSMHSKSLPTLSTPIPTYNIREKM